MMADIPLGRALSWAKAHPIKVTSVSGLAVQMARPLVTLLTLPLLLQGLGESGFGVWLIAISLFGILGFVSVGLSSSIVTYVGRTSRTEPDEDTCAKLSQLTTMGFLIAASCGTVLLVFMVPLILFLDWAVLLKLDDPNMGPETRQLVFTIVVMLAFSIVAVIPRQVMFGRLHGYLAHGLEFIGVLIGAAGLFIAITLSAPLWLIALAFILPSSFFLFLGGLVYLCCAGIRPFDLTTFEWPLFRRFRDDVLRMSAYQMAFAISSQTDLMLIGIILGSTAAVDFGIAQRVFSLVVMISLVLNYAQWPAMAQADAAGDRAKLLSFFRRTLMLVPMASGLLALCLVLVYEPLVAFWMGAIDGTDPLILWGMVAWVCVATASNTCDSLLRARNETSFLMRSLGAMAVINLGLTLLLLPLMGPAGAIWGSVIGYFVAVLIPYLWRLRADIWG